MLVTKIPQLPSLHPVATGKLYPIAAFVTIFRAADPDADLPARDARRFRQEDVGFVAFLYDTVTLRETQHPLCFHAMVFCLVDDERGSTSFLKTGGGGASPKPYERDYATLISELLQSIRAFPHGWTELLPNDLTESQLETHHA